MKDKIKKINFTISGSELISEDGTVFGKISRKGTIYRNMNKCGSYDSVTGMVFNNKGVEIGCVKEVSDKYTASDCDVEVIVPTVKVKQHHKSLKGVPEAKVVSSKPTENKYEPGLDSKLICSGALTRIIYASTCPMDTDEDFIRLNRAYGWNYRNWDELSAKATLPEAVLEKYEGRINKYVYERFHQ